MDLEVNLNNIKHHHLYRYCLKCFKKFQLPLLTSILFKDLQICPQCTQKLQHEKKLLTSQKQISQIYEFLKLKPHQRLQIFLPHQFRTTTQFCVAGFQGSLPLSHLQQFLGKCQKIRIHNIEDMKSHISYLSEAKSPKLNIMFSNITRLQLSNYKEQKNRGIKYRFNRIYPIIRLDELIRFEFMGQQCSIFKIFKQMQFPQVIINSSKQSFCLMKVITEQIKYRNQVELTSINYIKYHQVSFSLYVGFRQSTSFQQYKSLLMLSTDRMKTIYLNYLQFIQFYDKSLHNRYLDIHVVSLNNCHYSHGRRNL